MIALSDNLHDGLAWFGLSDSLHVDLCLQGREGSKDTFKERAVPAIKPLARVSRVFKIRLQQKQTVAGHAVLSFEKG